MISLGYSAVHQIFQLAAAAEQIGKLDSFRCSLFAAPHHWGHLLNRISPFPSAWPVGAELIPPDKVTEYPWPVLVRRILGRIPGGSKYFVYVADWFDWMMARSLENSNAKIFVASETCAKYSFAVAKKKGMQTVLDFHGIPSSFLEQSLRKAQQDFGDDEVPLLNSPAMMERKKAELELADHILVCSDFHAQTLEKTGIPKNRIHVIPLWIDTKIWRPPIAPKPMRSGKLKVVYAGHGSVSKGLPYLINAIKCLGDAVTLTVIGKLEANMRTPLASLGSLVTLKDYMPREQLVNEFHDHDILVMPSLGDSFGAVSVEAMASGLPVIVSEYCGAPVPAPSWRVAPFSSSAISERLQHYIHNPEKLRSDGDLALRHATHFTPQRYREKAGALFTEWLGTQYTRCK